MTSQHMSGLLRTYDHNLTGDPQALSILLPFERCALISTLQYIPREWKKTFPFAVLFRKFPSSHQIVTKTGLLRGKHIRERRSGIFYFDFYFSVHSHAPTVIKKVRKYVYMRCHIIPEFHLEKEGRWLLHPLVQTLKILSLPRPGTHGGESAEKSTLSSDFRPLLRPENPFLITSECRPVVIRNLPVLYCGKEHVSVFVVIREDSSASFSEPVGGRTVGDT